jgi:short-subunit dehydrogenase
MNELSNKKLAVVTGASAGLGLHFAKQLHAKGYNIIAIARRGERLAALCDELNGVRAQSASFLVVDLARQDELDRLCVQLKNLQIDLLVNNAGFGSFGFFEEQNLAAEREMVAVNILAPLALMHAVLPQMKSRKQGGIIAVSSVVGLQSVPYMATYSGTKAFDLFHALALRGECARFGVKVCVLCPGPTSTEFHGVANFKPKRHQTIRDRPQDVVAASIRAFEKNRAIVVTGWQGKLLTLPRLFLPKGVLAWLAERVMR